VERAAKTRLTTAVVLAVVFGSGVVLGLAADSSLRAEAPPVVVQPPEEAPDVEASHEPPEPERGRRYMYHEVDPNEEQLARIESIVAEMRALREAFDEERDSLYRVEILLPAREAIKGVLSPEQAAEYQGLLDDWEARRAADRENEDDRN
jgi:Spy/CpxP family protein refolding chaperone